jgi:S1-C subfamily serine protease
MSEPVAETSIAPTADAGSPPAVVCVLRREAVLPRERRGGLGAVALLCSLAGVASGFALATTILATQIAQSEGRFVRRSSFDSVRERAFLGVQYVTAQDGSARIVRVFGGTPAAEIGLAAGDLIVRYDAEAIDQVGELGYRVRASSIGHEATIEVRRGATTMVLHPTLIGAMLRDNF